VAGGAGTGFFAGVFNLDTATQGSIENGLTGLSFQNSAIRTQVLMRQK
jgi:hypothetical protein